MDNQVVFFQNITYKVFKEIFMIYDYAIFGGGVIGTSIQNKLVRLGHSCVLLEKGKDVAVGTTKANTALIHAGFDCLPNTLKARFNVRGNEMFSHLCKQLSVPFSRIGSIIMGDDKEKIQNLYDRGVQNKVPDMELLNREQLLSLVPNATENMKYALFAKSAGILSPYGYTIALAEESVINGGVILFDFNTTSVLEFADHYEIISDRSDKVAAKTLINAAGWGYNDVAQLINSEKYDVKFRVGEYYVLDDSEFSLVAHTIFPLPTATSKGVVITPAIDGKIIIGPTAKDTIDHLPETSYLGLKEIKEKANDVIFGIDFSKNIRNFAGTRSIVGDDFVVEKSAIKERVINIAGICSPGLTAAPAIAEYVACDLLNLPDNEKKMQPRTPITTIYDKTDDEINALIAKNKDYGNIVCRCEKISLAEIVEAINSPLAPTTTDAIKRRTRAGMGRCQSGFCLLKVMDELSRAHNLDFFEVEKENRGSAQCTSDIKSGGNYDKL